jgi:hypothetical protein
MKRRKISAFIVNTVIFTGMFIVTSIQSKGLGPVLDTLVWAQVAQTGIFIGGVVGDAIQKSKFFRPELVGK